ncbi:MAG: NAD(P)/FAD-dependent oxidoreductase [Novosphingobium sp.]
MPKYDPHNLKALVSGRAALLKHLEHADTAPLLMVLVHLGGDPTWLDRIAPHIKGPWSFHDATPDALRAELREAVADVLEGYASTGKRLPTELPMDLLPQMLRACTGQDVPSEYFPMVDEEMDLADADPKTVHWRSKPDPLQLANFQVLVVGAGFSGVGMGIKLKLAGIPFVIIEKNEDVGGTWYENTYPGIGVDTANHFYSYSFDNNNDWDHFFAKGDEIEAYIKRNTDRNNLRDEIRCNDEVLTLRWDQASLLWHAEIGRKDGSTYQMTANAVVSAVGMLNRPKVPPINGLESFAGPKFHTARWDHSVDYKGKRVGMIGTGASGMQVGPAIQPFVKQLTIFQRSPHWAMLNPLYFETVSDAKKWVLNNIPFYTKWFRFQLFWSSSDTFHHNLKVDPNWPDRKHTLNAANAAVRQQLEAHIAEEVGHDPELIRKATPDYPPYGKRMLRDNHWYRMLTLPNVDLVDEQIDHIAPDGVVTSDGKLHPCEILVLATGFETRRMLWPMQIEGRGGATILERWGDEDPRAHLGITVPEFPNLFLIYGPNTNLSHGGSAVFHSECQVRYIMQALRELVETGQGALEVKPEPFWDYQDKVDAAHSELVWAHPGVTSWYKNSQGRVHAASPWRLVDYRNMTAVFEPSEYEFTAAKVPA